MKARFIPLHDWMETAMPVALVYAAAANRGYHPFADPDLGTRRELEPGSGRSEAVRRQAERIMAARRAR